MSEQTATEFFAEVRQLFKETEARFKEDAEVRARDAEARAKEINAQIQENREQVRYLEGLFGSQWGRLLEALVKPGVLSLFQQRGFPVTRLHERSLSRVAGRSMETDLTLEGGDMVIVAEVKSRFGVDDVRELQQKLREFITFFPVYQGFKVYGAIAGLDVTENADRYAYKQGLFVLAVSGNDMVRIKNDAQFRPHDFRA